MIGLYVQSPIFPRIFPWGQVHAAVLEEPGRRHHRQSPRPHPPAPGTCRCRGGAALSLAQQTAQVDDSAARAHLEQLRHETAQHARALELREKDWDLAARVRERALLEARDQINVLLKELAADRGELRSSKARIADLESQNEGFRQQLALVVTRAVARDRALRTKKPCLKPPARKSKARIRVKKRPQSNRLKTRARR